MPSKLKVPTKQKNESLTSFIIHIRTPWYFSWSWKLKEIYGVMRRAQTQKNSIMYEEEK